MDVDCQAKSRNIASALSTLFILYILFFSLLF